MESFFSRYKNALVLMLVVLAQVVLLAMQVRRPAPDMPDGHNVRLWRYLVSSVVTPPGRLAHNVGLSVRGVWTNYIYLRHLREQNQDLKQENDRLRIEQASLAEDARAGQRLREMLDFRGRYIDKTLPAQVIGTSGTDQAKVIYIDKGSKDGLQVQMPVITPDGVIGKVKNVFPGSAQVLLISDQTSGAGVMLQSTRVRGVMKGNASGQPQMINISPDERIQPGEPVMTSGGDQVYPPGLPVGVVERVVADPETSYVNVVIKPNADLSRLEEVLVITAFSDKMPFAQEKDMMQSEVAALAEKQRAADILSEKLPSLRDDNAPESSLAGDGEASATAGGGDPARPMRPPPALHPDRYTPGAAPPAESLTPGAAPPMTHRVPTAETSAPAATHAAKTGVNGTGADGTISPSTGRDAAIVSRYPAKPVAAPPATASGGASSTTSSAVGSAGTTGAAAPRTVTRTPGSSPSGLTLPLQPADANAARRAAASTGEATAVPRMPRATSDVGAVSGSAGGAAGTPVAKTPRAVTAGTNAGGGSGLSSTGTSVPRTTAAASGVSGQTRPASGAQAGSSQASTARRIAIPLDSGSGGILTPAGMGSVLSTPRPRVPAPGTPNSGSGTLAGGTAKPATPKSSSGSPQAPGSQATPAPKKQSPPQQPATVPPGGV